LLGYRRGAKAQEENLFRRTNLFQYLEPKRDYWYPIPTFGGIYSPNATVIKADEQKGYRLLEVPETMSFVVSRYLFISIYFLNHSLSRFNYYFSRVLQRYVDQILSIITLENLI